MPPRRTAALALLLGLPALGTAAAAQGDAGAGSLEAFLRSVRAEREAEFARLVPTVDELAKRLGKARNESETRRVVAEIEKLGSEAVPLLVPYLDPGDANDAARVKRAEAVVGILSRAPNPALLDDLERMARTGSPRGRRLALRVMGSSADVPRAIATLRALYPELEGGLRAECLLSLARLRPDDPLIVSALEASHRDVLAAAVRALATEERRAPRDEVLALLNDTLRAPDVLPELVEYFTRPDQRLDEDVVRTFVSYAVRRDLPVETRLRVVSALPRFGVTLSARIRRDLEPLLESSDTALKDEALIALTIMRDGRARRELMRFYDDQVKNNDSWPLAYQRRGDIELRIGEYRDATRDYEKAIELHEDSARLPGNRDLWVNLARAQVLDGKLKNAAETLETFGMTSELRRTLREDPDFEELVKSSRYGDIFE